MDHGLKGEGEGSFISGLRSCSKRPKNSGEKNIISLELIARDRRLIREGVPLRLRYLNLGRVHQVITKLEID